MDIRRILEIDRRFFAKYQRSLLFLANTRVGRWYFRLTDHPKERVFTRILPFGVEWQNADGTFTFAAKTANKYANRIKHSLRHLKATLLALGLGAATRRGEALALQFLFAGVTTSFRPDADPESTTFDGYITRSSVSEGWSTIRGGAGNFGEDNNTDYFFAYWLATASSNQWDTIARGIFLFDTSAISTDATITAASFKFYCTGKTAPSDATASKRELELVASAPASNTAISNADYATIGSTSFGAIAYASITASAINTITLNGSGLSNITKGGVSKFGTRSGADLDNDAPTWASGDQYIVYGAFADNSGTTNDPTLEVTYSAVLTLSETVSSSDSAQKQPSVTKSETVSTSDSQTNLIVRVQTLSETQSSTDSLDPKSVGKVVSESVTIGESLLKTVVRTLSESVTMGESVTRAISRVLTLLETVTLTDILFFWRPRVRPSTSWTDRSEPSSSWTNRTPPTTNWS